MTLLDETMTMVPLLTLSVTRLSMRTGREGRVEAGHMHSLLLSMDCPFLSLTQVFIMFVSDPLTPSDLFIPIDVEPMPVMLDSGCSHIMVVQREILVSFREISRGTVSCANQG